MMPTSWPIRVADSFMRQYPVLSDKWDYAWGLLLKGVEQVWLKTGDEKYLDYIKRNIDRFVETDGSIKEYSIEEYNLDRINTGKIFFALYPKGLRRASENSKFST